MLFKKNRWIIGFMMLCFWPKMTCLAAEVSLFSMVEAEEKAYSYTGTVQTFTAPMDAIYKLEVWGGEGASVNGNRNPGGKGGYSIGYVKLKKGTDLYVVVGQNGNGVNGGYNGGGHGGCYGDRGDAGYGGGGCTHIAYENRGVLSNYSSYRDEVLIVAGGGGGQGGYSDQGYNPGGAGGGIAGESGNYNWPAVGNNTVCGGGTQTSPGSGGGFGYGGNGRYGNYNYGGGGGGWYGGGLGGTHEGGGGGSGYIGGVPEFEFSGEIYAPTTENGVRSGHGYARITMMKKLVAAAFQENEIEIIEKKQVSIKADVVGAVSHKWQIQKKTENIPSDEAWEDIDMEALGIEEKIEMENQTGIIELIFPAQISFSDCWFRLCIQGEEECLESEACLLTVIPLTINHLEYRGVRLDLEAGTIATTSDFEIWAVYNNSDIETLIRDDDELLSKLFFVDETEYTSQLILQTVSDSIEITMQLLHDDYPLPVQFSVSVYDLSEPVINEVIINGVEFYDKETSLIFEVVVDAEDNSDGILEYWYERKSDGYCSEILKDNTFQIEINGNDTIVIYVKDASGNVHSYEKEICYIDTKAPEIKDIYVEPEKEWTSGEAKVTVIAEDELSGLHDMAYSFDGGAIWQEENLLVVERSQTLKILVRDKVGNISDLYEVDIHKTERTGNSNSEQEVIEIINQIPYDEVLILEAEKRVLEAYNNLPVEEQAIAQEEEDEVEVKTEEKYNQDEKMKPSNEEGKENTRQVVEEIKIPLAEKQKDIGKIPVAVGATTVATATATGMYFCFFILFRRADVYYINELLQEEYVTFCPIRRKKNGYYIKLHPKHLNGIGNKRFALRVSKRFAKKNDGKYLEVLFEKRVVYTLCMKEKMYFYLTEKV